MARILFKVQRRVATPRMTNGTVRIGKVWVDVARNKRKTVAETIAIRSRIDHKSETRVVQQ